MTPLRLQIGFLALAVSACGGDSGGGGGTAGDSLTGIGAGPGGPGGGPGNTGESDGSGATDDGGATEGTAGAGCDVPPPDPEWLTAQLDHHVATLAGARSGPTGSVGVRATPAQRSLAAEWVRAELRGMGFAPIDHAYGSGTNVYVDLPAQDPSAPWVLVGAHYDTVDRSPGANDNATGVAMAMAAARHLADHECRTKNFRIVFFDEEEIGLVGSAAMADKLVTEGTNVHSVHTIDQMGWDADGDLAIELEVASPATTTLYMDAAMAAGLPKPIQASRIDATDHKSFRDRGFEAVGLTEEFVNGDTTPHYHLPSDTFDTVDLHLLTCATTLLNQTLSLLADE